MRFVLVKTAGLRTEILITLTILLGAALLLGGIMMLHLMEKSLLEERVGQLESLSLVLAQSLSQQEVDRDPRPANLKNNETLLYRLPVNVNCDAWWLYDQNFVLLDSRSSSSTVPLPASARQMTKLSGDLQQTVHFPLLLNFFDRSEPSAHFIVPIKKRTQVAGILELSFSLSDIRLRLQKSQQVMALYIFLYGIVLVLAGCFLLEKNIIRPAKNLLKATEDVRHGNLETRLPTVAPTEIAQLAVAYNQMVDALKSSRLETEQHILSLKETNQKLQQSRNELVRSEKMASVGQLAAGLAHELGNPLAALIGYLELLKSSIESASQQDIVKRALTEATRIDFLVRELLNFSRPTEDSSTESVDMVEQLNASVQLLKNQGAFAGIRISSDFLDLLPSVQIDPNKLQQVFVNLLLNAVQACDKRDQISLSAGCDKNKIWVEIKDTGSGMSADHLNKIFDPFFTTKPPGEGTGLGLAMSQRIIEGAGGRIEVESQLGEGSVFRVIFMVP